MHVIRPKSAKGRTRPKVTEARTADDELLHENRPFSPHPPSHPPRPPPTPSHTPSHRLESSPSPRAFFRHDNPSSAVEKALDIPVLSLNKYKVLPSIEKRSKEEASSSDMEEKSSRSRLHACRFFRSDQETERASSRTVRSTSWCQEGETGVLLALRTPCGQRLKCQFQPTDTLRDVVATAEDQSGKRYEHVLIETMEVPRRSFTNLNMTLSQCGIINKSVLCISLKDSP
ncbi:UBX domain-containing protein 10 [Pangasianodon hypophthalmus]|uniref:UBX domain-containing protein 10 n=1 Tax=Pangasianodon hypophthalmus TaxID=310915 RepID=UPI0023075FF7|nr:UBX domain-containing protein 10 [Pangasianodon hypophthalmus]